jgi:membrane protease YdiL (CAAX protease family)
MLWRFGMFLPFAVFLGYVIDRRPSLLPYMMVVHGLLDLQLPIMLFAVASPTACSSGRLADRSQPMISAPAKRS